MLYYILETPVRERDRAQADKNKSDPRKLQKLATDRRIQETLFAHALY